MLKTAGFFLLYFSRKSGYFDVYDIPAKFGTEFEAAEKCSHASLMTYYNDIHRDMAAIFSCVNGCVFHS